MLYYTIQYKSSIVSMKGVIQIKFIIINSESLQ